MYGIVQPLTSISQQTNFTCPSGNCTYPPFSSLSVCSSCKDHSKWANRSPGGGLQKRYRIPNGVAFSNQVRRVIFGTANHTHSIAHKHIDTLIWSQSLFRHRGDPKSRNTRNLHSNNTDAHAIECALFYCVKQYTSQVINGQLVQNTTTDETFTGNPTSWQLLDPNSTSCGDLDVAVPEDEAARPRVLPPARNSSICFDPRLSPRPQTDLQLSSPSSSSSSSSPARSYNISQSAIDSISSFFQATFVACDIASAKPNSTAPGTAAIVTSGAGWNCSGDQQPKYYTTPWNMAYGFYGADDVPQFEPCAVQALWAAADVRDVFMGIAASMSNALWAGADSDSDSDKGSTAAKHLVVGKMGVRRTLHRVEWRWIGLHLVVAVVSVGFVVWTLGVSRRMRGRVPLWGSNTIAVLARGEEEVVGLLKGARTVDEM